MLKTSLDYSNTIIYKITCNDNSITDVYVGHTTNFVQRKHAHKNTCINEHSPSYKCKLYEVIRTNGGWNNWKMEIVDFFNCKDLCEAKQKEQEYFVSLHATLNSIEPFPTQKPTIVVEKKEQKDANGLDAKYYCEKCEYDTHDKWKFDRHLFTKKHKIDTIDIDKVICKDKNKEKDNIFFNCCCGKNYTYRQGLWKHKQNCNYKVEPNNNIQINSNDLIQILINENKELKNMFLEVCNKIQDKNIIIL
jgi:hypothetical protein